MKYFKISLLLILLFSLPIIGTALITYKNNYDMYQFTDSPRYNFMQEEALKVAKRFCGGEHEWSQLGYGIDREHVNIICDDNTGIEIRIVSDLSIKREK